MLLNCPTCARSYTVRHADIGEAGRSVICPTCQTQWFVAGAGLVPTASNDDAKMPSRKRLKTAAQLAAGPSYLQRHVLPHTRSALAVTAALALGVILVGQRERIVRTMPRTATIYSSVGLGVNVQGLTFAKLEPLRLASSDVTVTGAIRNVAGRRVTVPRIAYEVRDAIGTPLLTWSETIPPKSLDAGKTVAFESSPHHVPADSRTVTVRFVTDDAGWPRRNPADRSEK